MTQTRPQIPVETTGPLALHLEHAVADPAIRAQLAIVLAKQLQLKPDTVEEMLSVSGRPITRPMPPAQAEAVAVVFRNAGLAVKVVPHTGVVQPPVQPVMAQPSDDEYRSAEQTASLASPLEAVMDADLHIVMRQETLWAVGATYVGLVSFGIAAWSLLTNTTLGQWLRPYYLIPPIFTGVGLLEPYRNGKQALTVSARSLMVLFSTVMLIAALLTAYIYELLPKAIMPLLIARNQTGWPLWMTHALFVMTGVQLISGYASRVATGIGLIPNDSSAGVTNQGILTPPEKEQITVGEMPPIAIQANSPLMTPQIVAVQSGGFRGAVHSVCKWLLVIWSCLCGGIAVLDLTAAYSANRSIFLVAGELVIVLVIWLFPTALLGMVTLVTRPKTAMVVLEKP
jgi:hypothetical protein